MHVAITGTGGTPLHMGALTGRLHTSAAFCRSIKTRICRWQLLLP